MKRCPGLVGDWTLSEVIFDLPQLQSGIEKLEARSSEPDFWSDSGAANKDLQKLSRLRGIATPFLELDKAERDVAELYELLKEDPDAETEQEADTMALAL